MHELNEIERIRAYKPKLDYKFMEKCLKVIEGITYPDFATSDKEKLYMIYEIAHVSRNPYCIKSHKDWIKNVHKLAKFLKKAGLY